MRIRSNVKITPNFENSECHGFESFAQASALSAAALSLFVRERTLQGLHFIKREAGNRGG
jgi:hypothetical protein